MMTEIKRLLSHFSVPENVSERGETTGVFTDVKLADSEIIPNRFYQDGCPYWPGAPTRHDADNQRRRLAKRLRRFAGTFPRAAELADRMASCKAGNRCHSGACPVCLRAAQRCVVAHISDLCHRNKIYKYQQVVAVSVMSPSWRVPLGQLNSLDLDSIFKCDLAEAFDQPYRPELPDHAHWLVLGMDISLNDDIQKGHGVFWQVQFYGIAGVNDQNAFADVLRGNFHGASETVKRPVRVAACDGSPKALSYVFKTNFVRRIAYFGNGVTHKGEPRKCWRTRKVSLKAKEEIELRLWLTQIGIFGRVLGTRPFSSKK